MMRRLLIIGTLILLLGQMSLFAQVPLPTSPPGSLTSGYIRASRLGVTFINSTDHPISENRYQQALLLGAGWTRWPLYWDRVETSPGSFDWTAYDQLVAADLRHGLNINAILLGRPGFHQEGGSIRGLDAPIFSDGSDIPGAGKSINPANEWANFVWLAVNRYKPGGLLAQQQGWPAGWGIRIWEAWNEPDLAMFWRGTVPQYARLLKVTYLAAHQADPQTQVMFGGLAYSNPDVSDWLRQVLAIFAQDENSARYNWYMDIVGVHNYSYARRSGEMVWRVRENLAQHGLARPVWLNENGVPVWDDYPGPTWAVNDPGSRYLRATAQQQAAFVVQSAAYAWAQGADVVMYHQLYDDCGNQRAGTDFPPNDGGMCSGGACWGDAHGLFRNLSDSACFRQHPLPGTPRPAAYAYRTLAEVFGTAQFEGGTIHEVGRATVITFERVFPSGLIHVAWNRSLQSAGVSLPASAARAMLYTIDGDDRPLTPDEDGNYVLSLPPASPDDYPYVFAGDEAGIGGQPFIIVESTGGSRGDPVITPQVNPALVPFHPPIEATLRPRLMPTAGPVVPETPPPRLIGGDAPPPADDRTPPVTSMSPLPLTSPATFTVAWQAEDAGGIAGYLVWVRINGGDWQVWLADTTDTSAEYHGESGSLYEFAVWAVDAAGNWSANTDLQPQAYTRVE